MIEMQRVVSPNLFASGLLRFYLSIMYFVQQCIHSIRNSTKSSHHQEEEIQRNAVVWKIVLIVVVVIAAFALACALVNREFTGEFTFLGFGFKIACK